MAEGKRISLVLGSGGARGLAHIGIIHEIEARGYEIASICGCSVGSLIGGIYAAGKLDEFEQWVRAITKVDIVNLLDIAWEKNGLVKGDKIMDTLTELVGDKRIEDLDIPFTAVATDITNERELWMNTGPLFDAIRASISLPFFFTPVTYKDSLLIDGGVLNPVPIAPAFNDDSDYILAVNLGGSAINKLDSKFADSKDDSNGKRSAMHRKLNEFIDELSKSFSDDKSDVGMYEIGNQAFDAMQATIARQKLAAYPPDYTIEIPSNACGTLEFDRAKPMIDMGREKAKALFDSIAAKATESTSAS